MYKMEQFAILKASLEKDINELNDKIINTKKDLESANLIKDIIEHLYNKKIDLIDIDYKNKTKKIYPELSSFFSLIDTFNDYMNLMKLKKYWSINSNELQKILQSVNLSKDEIKKALDELEFCQELDEIINDPLYDDLSMKQEFHRSNQFLINLFDNYYHQCIEKLIEIIKDKYNQKYSSNFLELTQSLQNKVDELERINKLFDDSGLIGFFEDKEMLEKFYDWMKQKIDVKFQLSLIEIITEYGISKVDSIKNNEEVDEILNHNRDNVLESLQELAKKEQNITFENIDLSKFDLDSKKIILKMKEVYAEISKLSITRCSMISRDEMETVNHLDYYLFEDRYNWDIILSDIEENLLPNIYTKNDLVLTLFELIIQIYNKYQKELEIVNKNIKIITEYLNNLTPLIKYAEKYDAIKCDYLIENNYDRKSSLFYYYGSYEYVDMCYYITHQLKQFIDELMNNKAKLQDLIDRHMVFTEDMQINEEKLQEDFEIIYGICHKKINLYQNSQNDLLSKDDSKVEHEYAENLVFCIDDLDLSEDGYRRELRETVKDLTSKNFRQLQNGNTGREGLSTIRRKTPSGVEIEYNNLAVKPYAKTFLPYRFSGQANYRTGLIHFNNIDPIIKKKLQKKYHLGNQSVVFGIFMVISSIKSNHNAYSDFENYLNDNIEKIDELGKMFADSNTDIEQLYRIIDDGIDKCQTLIGEKEY